MIIVLDTTVLLSNPQFVAHWWQQFIERSKHLGARIVVPRVVVVEAVANHNRTILALKPQIAELGKRDNRFGLDGVRQAAIDALHAKADRFEADLYEHLEESGVDVIEPAAVDHMELINRAVSFRKPYDADDRKDGYRDTLNWLTVLDLADQYPGDEVWWISQNQADFGNGDKKTPTWHEEIAEELGARDLADRVRWEFNISTLLLTLAGRTAPVPEGEQPLVLERVDLLELARLLSSEILGRGVSPRDAALPPRTESAEISSFVGLDEVEWDGLAESGEEDLVARFTGIAHVGLELAEPTDTGAGLSFDNKALRITGVANLTHEGAVTSVSVSNIVALESDPGHAAWQRRSETSRRLGVASATMSVAEILAHNRAGAADLTLTNQVFGTKSLGLSDNFNLGTMMGRCLPQAPSTPRSCLGRISPTL
ncbi:PIN domain-containing protein [Rhodococcus sp. NPDC055112]